MAAKRNQFTGQLKCGKEEKGSTFIWNGHVILDKGWLFYKKMNTKQDKVPIDKKLRTSMGKSSPTTPPTISFKNCFVWLFKTTDIFDFKNPDNNLFFKPDHFFSSMVDANITFLRTASESSILKKLNKNLTESSNRHTPVYIQCQMAIQDLFSQSKDFYCGLDHVYLRSATFRKILLSSSGKVD